MSGACEPAGLSGIVRSGREKSIGSPSKRAHLNVLIAAKSGSDFPRWRPVFVGAQFHWAIAAVEHHRLSPGETGLLHWGKRVSELPGRINLKTSVQTTTTQRTQRKARALRVSMLHPMGGCRKYVTLCSYVVFVVPVVVNCFFQDKSEIRSLTTETRQDPAGLALGLLHEGCRVAGILRQPALSNTPVSVASFRR
jgi:hypothetical protein